MKNAIKKEGKRSVRFIVITFIRAILIIAFFSALYSNRRLVLSVSILALFLTFLPTILNFLFKIKVPAEFEIIVLFFIYGLFYFGEVKGIYTEFWWWDIFLNLLSAGVLGFIGLAVFYTLYNDKILNASPQLIAILSFCFAFSVGAIVEISEFGMDNFFGFNLQGSSLVDTMKDLITNLIGSAIVSLIGYFYVKKDKLNVISKLVTNVVEKNKRFFGSRNIDENMPEDVINLIKKGEGRELEFKSTLRKNLHTNELDKKIEHSVLKTINAYLNSDGGTLLVGISDNGEIMGLGHDEFPDHDKLNLYFTNLIKQHIGSEYLPFIKYDIFKVRDKHVLKIDCEASDKHVFLKLGQDEEFYIRNGASSAKLSGSALIDYINNKFGK